MSRSRATRVTRATIAASVATFIALMSHVAGGGAMPEWLGIAVPWVLSLAVCTVLAGRALSLFRLSAAVVVSQLLFHLLFVLGASGASPGSAGATGHVHGVPLLDLSTGSDGSGQDLSMWLAHGLAAVVTIAALYRGERLIVRLMAIAREVVAWVRRRLRGAPTPAPLPLGGARFIVQAVEPHRIRVLASSIPRRGPPLSFVV